MFDLVVLVADKNMEHALRGLLLRHQAIGIRPIALRIYDHPERDSGCYNQGPTFLRTLNKTYHHALLILDRDGSGREADSREAIEESLEEQLVLRNLGDRVKAVVIEPELENWLWSPSPHVATALGWHSTEELRNWLEEQQLWKSTDDKPINPKEAVERAMRKSRKPRSSAVYLSIAQNASFQTCKDLAFSKLLRTLRAWFPPE